MAFPIAKIEDDEPRNKGGRPVGSGVLSLSDPERILKDYCRAYKNSGGLKNLERLLAADPKAFFDDFIKWATLKQSGNRAHQSGLTINIQLPKKVPVGKAVGFSPKDVAWKELKVESGKLLPEGRDGADEVASDGVADQGSSEERV